MNDMHVLYAALAQGHSGRVPKHFVVHISSLEEPEPGPFPTGISADEAPVRERLFDGGDDEEGEPTLVGLVLLARFVPV